MAGENVKKWEKFVNLDCPNLSQKNVEIAKKANPRMQRSIRKIFEVLPKYGPPKHYETWLSKTKHWKNSKKEQKKRCYKFRDGEINMKTSAKKRQCRKKNCGFLE